ncbi:hypothetical protein [Streptomyces sp. H27-C3]|uniref:hypothetical protein n=1 Tax=Streptomyces sp. H27-C3 TaxID=3046305 RepID=UPI0024B9F4BC|nr:hypothetical protein [Streptomyces sp. H27-C3]MDJ0463185.1 hypothetical protein [Streptomyces sp. H27-C3]
MAYIPRAPLTTELGYGTSDGSIRKAAPDRGGTVERLTEESRESVLDHRSYGSLGVGDDAGSIHINRYPVRSHRYA